MAAFVYLNGYPGVGKLAIAKELTKLIPKSRVFDNHLIIDPVAAIFDRGMEGYQPLRKTLRQTCLASIVESAKSTQKDVTWIFTDQQSSSPVGTASALDYRQAASSGGLTFFSVVLQCELEENLRRVQAAGRGASNTKLNDVDIVRSIREKEDIFRFKDASSNELQLDVTNCSAVTAAGLIFEHMSNANVLNDNSSGYLSHIQVKTFADIRGFKHIFIKDIRVAPPIEVVQLLCWVQSRPRHHGGLVFVALVDSTGTIQAVIEKAVVENWEAIKSLTPESSVIVSGSTRQHHGEIELCVQSVSTISRASRLLFPEVRKLNKELLSSQNSAALLASRNVYLRNPLVLELSKFRSRCFSAVRQWFEEHDFIDFSAPLITPSILYEPSSAVHISNLKTKRPLYLSQCAGFYLEAGAHAHERVYNLGPSFRNESRTNRHLMEYWHIKAELCSGDMQDIMDLVEIFLRDFFLTMEKNAVELRKMLGTEQLETRLRLPFARIRYRDAISFLQQQDFSISFGQNILKAAEDALTSHFGGPLWITHKPRQLEPFPYSICSFDPELTMTADLIAPNGFGEICGVAEKSFTREELEQRLEEKGKKDLMDPYQWVLDSRDFGMVPHTAFGMGFERVIRWLCGAHHVKDLIPFPRIFGRDPFP